MSPDADDVKTICTSLTDSSSGAVAPRDAPYNGATQRIRPPEGGLMGNGQRNSANSSSSGIGMPSIHSRMYFMMLSPLRW